MIIPLEQQVCSIELAKELEKLGVKQESLWSWVGGMLELTGCLTAKQDERAISAFTIAELLGRIRKYVQSGALHDIEVGTFGKDFDSNVVFIWDACATYLDSEYLYQHCQHQCENVVNAVANVLIRLIEKGIVKP